VVHPVEFGDGRSRFEGVITAAMSGNCEVSWDSLESARSRKQSIPMANAVDISGIRPPPDEAGRDESASKLMQGSDRRQLVEALA